ncbi:MAG: hypothetical protein ACOC3W_01800 [Thermodesulfobacteriota bacterium]
MDRPSRLKNQGIRNLFWLLLVMLVPLCLAYCGDTGEMDDSVSGGGSPAPAPSPNATLSSEVECPQPFRAEGHLLFDISRSGEGLYDFTLVNFATQEPQAFLARGTGPFEGTVETVVPPGDYELVVNPDSTWQADIIGDVQRYRTDCDFPDTGTDIDLSARYTGCGAGCCALENGVAGCDCNSGRCYCNNDTFSDICTCSCN